LIGTTWQELKSRHALLAWSGALMLVFVVLGAALAVFDSRTVTGLNVWFKPIKFAASISIYLLTMAWYLQYLKPARPRTARVMGTLIAVVMVVEYAAIFMQGARGVISHYNYETPFDGLVFAAMGILISLNTFFLVYVLYLFLRNRPDIPQPYLWGIRFGLLLFLVFGLEGRMMIGNNAHAIGVPDGGAGLPFLGWSTEGGDLRYAHFFGMHALQVLPISGWLLHKNGERLPFSPLVGVVILSALYLALASWILQTALQGIPIIS
jgi:hypothetical protein